MANDTVLAPCEPTTQMIDAAVRCFNDEQCGNRGDARTCSECRSELTDLYAAMLAAAPEQPPASQDKADAARWRAQRQIGVPIQRKGLWEIAIGQAADSVIDAAMKEQQRG
jgi:hypothetical protein